MDSLFRRVQDWFRSVYSAIRRTDELNEDVASYFDRIFGFGEEANAERMANETEARPASETGASEESDTRTDTSEDISEGGNTEVDASSDTEDSVGPSRPCAKSEWNKRAFMDEIFDASSPEVAAVIYDGVPVRLLRNAGLVRADASGQYGLDSDAFMLDPRFEGMSVVDAERMAENVRRYQALRESGNSVSPSMLWEGISTNRGKSIGELFQAYDERISSIRQRYSLSPEEQNQWKGKLPADLFKAHRQLVTDVFMAYPKVMLGDVMMLQGLEHGDMPFQKELIQTEMLQLILGERVILLPRYADITLNAILGTSLREGSIPDGIAIATDSGRYVDYKAVTEGNLVRRINKAVSEGADIVFAAVDRFPRERRRRISSPLSQLRIPDGFEIYVYDTSNGNAYKAGNKNKELDIELLSVRQEHDSRLRMLSSAFIPYITGDDSVNNETIDYSSYQQAQLTDRLFQTGIGDDIARTDE